MYPPSKAVAIQEQLEAEAAVEEMVRLALELWLPLAERAVLQAAAEPPPDATAAADKEAQWNYLVEAILLYGVGMLAARAYDRAMTAIAGQPLTLAEDALPPLKFDMSGMPTRAELRARVDEILARRTGMDTAEVYTRSNSIPAIREFVNRHTSNVKSRVIDAVGRVFRRVRKVVDDAPADSPDYDVDPIFDPLDPQWEDAATEVGQTQTTAALNAAAEQAAKDSGRQLEIEWVAIMDSHTREAHAVADGQRRPPGASFDVGGEQLRFPGDPLGSVENTINCRCRLFAYFTDEVRGELQAGAPIIEMTKDVLDGLRQVVLTSGILNIPTGLPDGSGLPLDDVVTEMADWLINNPDSHASEKVAPMTDYRSFSSVLAVIGTPTDDGRMFADDIALTFRDFPLPLLWQKQSAGGHYDAFTVGVIESAGIVGKEVIGKGYLLNTPEADEAAVQIEHGVTGPSVDLGDTEWELRDENGQPISEEDWWDDPDMEVIQTVLSAKVLAATLVATPAFGQTSIELGELVTKGEEALVAAAGLLAAEDVSPVYEAGLFSNPGFTEPTYPHITDDGRIQGHLAAWNVCHVGIADRCVLAPRSQTDYGWFHTSPPVQTEVGKVKVGRLTVGGGHAGPRLGPAATVAHYDNVGTCFALVHVGEDEHGIWFSGIPDPDATEEQVAQGLRAPLSGDWRNVGGNLELVAALSVNTPGFPLVASGATDANDEPLALIASLGPCPEEGDEFARAAVRGADQLELARHIVKEWRASERRDAAAAELISGEARRQAAAIIGKA